MSCDVPAPAVQEITIRPMRMEDLPQVQAVDELSFSTPWPKNAFRFELLENPNGHCWVAESAEGQVVALLVCWLIIDEIHIATIAVHPDYRGAGIGRRMMMTGLGALIPLGAVSATLEVRAGNAAAQKLYRHFGFVQVGRRKRYYKDTGEDALLLTVEPLGPAYLAWLGSGGKIPWWDSNPF